MKKKKGGADDGDLGLASVTAGAAKKDKKKGKKNAAKSRNQMWVDLYKKSKLEKGEIEELKDQLV